METMYLTIALVTAGVALLSGVMNLYVGFYRDGEKTDLLFGFISLSAFIFLLLPPMGFIMGEHTPYSQSLEIKRIFIWTYYALLPFFIELYSGYKKRSITFIIVAVLIASYFVMLISKEDRAPWFYISRIALGLIFYYGIAGTRHMFRNNKKLEGKWLLSAMIIYGILFILSTINEAGHNYFGKMLGTETFFPLHLNLLAFTALMSIRLSANKFEKFRLERTLRWREKNWNLLIQNMQLMILELDKNGTITYLNQYGVAKLGYRNQQELLGINWFDKFALKEEAAQLKSQYISATQSSVLPEQFTSNLKSKSDQTLSFNWTYIFASNYDDSIRGVISIGVDITNEISSLNEIKALKNELEKENLLLKGTKLESQDEPDIIGQSEEILVAIQKARQVAKTNAGVLLQGETGSGKELFADLIHRNSFRSNKVFIKVNCATLPAELIESELFGHEKGSFTGAINSRKGKFELADGGTIFLDEVGELPLSLQSKLLRVLQGSEFTRVGGQQTIKTDVRVIAATNRTLAIEVKAGTFREDLFYRLNVFPIMIPPLRNRISDLPLLISHFVTKFSVEHRKELLDVSKADLQQLSKYSWPGNIRELINLIERSVILSAGPTLLLDWQKDHSSVTHRVENETAVLEDIEKAHILKVLHDCNWKINGDDGAAAKLKLHPSTLRSRLKKLHIDRDMASKLQEN